MHHHRTIQLAALAASLALACGCAKKASDEDYDDVAVAVGALVANDSGGEVGSMEASATLATGGTVNGLTAQANGKYSGQFLGLTYSYDLTCKDSNGSALATCDATTESATLKVDWSGNLKLPSYKATITRTGDWTLSGLQSDTATFNGHGTFDVDTEFKGFFNTRNFLLDYDGNYAAVQWNRTTWTPSGGTITYNVHAQRKVVSNSNAANNSEMELDVQVVVTFAADGTATMTLDGERHYSLNLDNGNVTAQ